MSKKSELVDDNDLRSSMMAGNIEIEDPEKNAVSREEVPDGKIFGLNAVERMILSIVLFLTVTVLGVALLFVTGTIALR